MPDQVNPVAVVQSGHIRQRDKLITPEEFPAASGLYMRYRLQLDPINDDVWSATLWCRSGRYGTTVVANFQEKATKLYTELFYSGMP